MKILATTFLLAAMTATATASPVIPILANMTVSSPDLSNRALLLGTNLSRSPRLLERIIIARGGIDGRPSRPLPQFRCVEHRHKAVVHGYYWHCNH